MIIITGPGRSGTSVLAQFCLKMGYDPGGSWYDCVDAGMEHPRVAAINDALFLEAMRTGSVQKTLEEHSAEMRSLDLTVVKDPRFTFHPAILRAWYSVRSDLKVLMTYRTPEHSVASRKRHGKDLIHKEKARPNVLRCDFANEIEAMLDLDIPFALLLFPNFLTQYEHVHEAFETLGMPFDRDAGQDVWNTLVNLEKVHVRPTGSKQKEKPVTTKLPAEPRWILPALLPLRTSRFSPVIVVSLLIALVCAPVGWMTMGASAVSMNQDIEVGSQPTRRLKALPLSSTPPRLQGRVGVAFDSAFRKGLAAYSVQLFPFETMRIGRAMRHRGRKPPGHPTG